jgi:hypothetical protein
LTYAHVGRLHMLRLRLRRERPDPDAFISSLAAAIRPHLQHHQPRACSR